MFKYLSILISLIITLNSFSNTEEGLSEIYDEISNLAFGFESDIESQYDTNFKTVIKRYIDSQELTISNAEQQILSLYIDYHNLRIHSGFDSAHKQLIKALNIIDDKGIKSISTLAILESLALTNIQINHAEKGYEYMKRVESLIGEIDGAQEKFNDIFYVYAYQKNDTSLMIKAKENQLQNYINFTTDTLSINYTKAEFHGLKKDFDSAIFYYRKIYNLEPYIDMIVIYQLAQNFEALNKQDSVIKYSKLFVPYLDKSPALFQQYFLKILIDHKTSIGDTTNLATLQNKYLESKNPLSDGVIISNIIKEEFNNIKTPQESSFTFYLILGILTLVLIVSGWIIYKKNTSLSKLSYQLTQTKKISDSKEEQIKKIIEQFIIDKKFLDPNTSQTKLVEDYQIGNIKYLSQVIQKEYDKKFPVFIKDLRINYLKTNYKDEFIGMNKSEIASKLGFGSYRTFKDHVEKSSKKPLGEFINSLN